MTTLTASRTSVQTPVATLPLESKTTSMNKLELEDVMAKVEQIATQFSEAQEALNLELKDANAKIDLLSKNVQTRFEEANCFQCPGHESVVGHYDILKKAQRKGREAAEEKEGHSFNKKAEYKVISRKNDPKEYKKYSDNQNFIEKWINYNYVTVVTHYHHDNIVGCTHYQDYLKGKDISQKV